MNKDEFLDNLAALTFNQQGLDFCILVGCYEADDKRGAVSISAHATPQAKEFCTALKLHIVDFIMEYAARKGLPLESQVSPQGPPN